MLTKALVEVILQDIQISVIMSHPGNRYVIRQLHLSETGQGG